jgi:5-formyltetrahydrofolate cyclo-ligase
MAVPRLADQLPFHLLDPERLSLSPWEAAAKEGAARAGRKVAATELPSVDLVVCGSVAVNRQGARVGKGGGFSDLEVAFLVEAGVIRPDTVLATTVHELQVVDEPIPETIHDFRLAALAAQRQTPRQSAEQIQFVTTSSSLLKAGPAGGLRPPSGSADLTVTGEPALPQQPQVVASTP